jgi:hypothetical protein
VTRPTDEEFEELKRKRDESVAAHVAAICAERGWDPATASVHVSGAGACYCACPEGPCQHVWDGPDYASEDECCVSITCSRCGTPAVYHDMRCAP